MTADIQSMHDRTIDAALSALGLTRMPLPASQDEEPLNRILDMTLSLGRFDTPLREIVDAVGIADGGS